MTVASPRAARADTPPPPNWQADMSANNVVPGPGDPNLEDSQGYLSASDTPGELCVGVDSPSDATSLGLYHAAAGSNGPLVVDLSAYYPDFQCTEGVDQATIDDLVAHPEDYYLQVDSESYPDGATRGQVVFVPPTLAFDVLAWFCPTGTQFPASDKTLAKQCGSMSVPGQDFAAGPGATSLDYAGTFPWDVHVEGPDGYDAHLADADLEAGGTCDPAAMTCNFGSLPFTFFNLPLGLTTVDVSAIPTGMKLAYAHVTIDNETIPVTYGPNGHVAFDLTGAYQAFPIVRYYFIGSPKVAPPSEAAPTVDLAQQAVASNGAIALSLAYGAATMGNGPVSYSIQASTDGGAYKALASSSKPVAVVREQPGHSYQFRVQATNAFGVNSAWVAGDPVSLDVVQDNDPSVSYFAYGDGWVTGSTKGALGGTTTSSNDGSATAELTTDAIAIGVVMPFEPSGGHANIQFGYYGSQTVDLSAGSWQPRQVVAVQNFGGLGTYTVDVRPWGDGRVDLDGFIVLH